MQFESQEVDRQDIDDKGQTKHGRWDMLFAYEFDCPQTHSPQARANSWLRLINLGLLPPNVDPRQNSDFAVHGAVFGIGTGPRIMKILQQAQKLAQEYRTLSGKTLVITGEVAEYEAARLLKLELTPARNEGYDAIEDLPDGSRKRIQVKGRYLLEHRKPGQRLSRQKV